MFDSLSLVALSGKERKPELLCKLLMFYLTFSGKDDKSFKSCYRVLERALIDGDAFKDAMKE